MKIQPNAMTSTPAHHYKLEPGDATCYRFSLSFLPDDPIAAYTIAPGVGYDPMEYIQITIDMPGGTGVCTITRRDLKDLGEVSTNGRVYNFPLGYAASHGMGSVNSYTLAAVLLACQVLIDNTGDLERAAANMLRAPELLSR